jgi:anaerobic ribonucleoside-triphosphate reductase activating protein
MSAPQNSLLEAGGNAGPRLLKVGGVTPFTATDYPGKLSAVVFVQGCPWRCGYCHNPHLQPRLADSPLHWSNILARFERRVGLIDAVVFSGGEPTIDPALAGAIADVRALGFGVGLHSGGIYPKRLAEILPLVDWIGLDIKAPFDSRYDRVTGVPGSAAQALESAHAVIAGKASCEFRTTIHPSLLSEDDILELATELAAMGVANYVLQLFRAQGCGSDALNSVSVAGYPGSEVIERVAALFPHFTLRRD